MDMDFKINLMMDLFPNIKTPNWGDTRAMTGNYRVYNGDGRFGSKVGQIGPKWDKSVFFFRSD